MADEFESPKPRSAPRKSLAEAVIDGALKAGSSMVSLLSGLLAAALIMYSGYVLYDTFAAERAASSNSWDLLQFKPELIDEGSVPKYAPGLESVNADYRAWLTVYDSGIDYPVMQGPNDLYYAYHDIYGKESLTGSLYLAADNAPDFSDSYNLVYGHHMDNGAMFGALDLFRDQDYFDSHREALLITPSGVYDVTFFAVASTDAYEPQVYTVGDRAGEVVDFLAAGGPDGVGLGTTVHQFDPEIAADAVKVVALSTCASGDGTSGRLVVFGRMTEHVVYITLTVRKEWDDKNDQDGQRPSSLAVTLSDDRGAVGQVVLKADNEWTASIENLPMNRNWKPVPYTWTEEAVEGYTLTGRVTEDGVTTLTNSHTTETTALTLSKVWQDDNNRDGLRPDSLPVTLSANGKVVYTDTLAPENGWNVTVDVLPVNENGQRITYAWAEADIPGYRPESALSGTVTTITNIHDIDTVSRSVTKLWDDADNQDGIRPKTVTVTLNADGTPVREVILDAAGGWSATVDNLPMRNQGKVIDYTWTEGEIPGYTLSRTETEGAVTTLTNTHAPELVNVSVRKLWADEANKNKARPDRLTVRLLRNGEELESVVLSPDNNWQGTVKDLPRYEKGSEIRYTWSEPKVRNYRLRSVEVNGYKTRMTNEYDPSYLPEWPDEMPAGGFGWIRNVGDCLE